MSDSPRITQVLCHRCGALAAPTVTACPQCGSSLEVASISASVLSLDSAESFGSAVSAGSAGSAVTASRIGISLVSDPATPSSGSESTRVEVPRGAPEPRREDPTRSTGNSLSVDADPLIGFVVSGRYRILERLGAGGMGMVYKVEHQHLGKLLALKLLSGELTRDESVQKRFKREAFLAARLTHQNTVQVFDFGISDGLTWLVMELVRGEDLSRIIRREGALPIERAIPIMAQVCTSIEEAHSLGIIHRDIKPANIMVTQSLERTDHAKVLDFGLAKLRNSSELNEVTSRGAVMGTPYYMAPEQIQAGRVDERADIYAIGAVLYRLVTGEPVFAGAGPQQIFHGHLSLQPVPPHVRAPNQKIPPALSAVILKALAKHPSERFQKVEQLRHAIIAVLEEEGAAASAGDRHTIPIPQIFPENATRDEVAAYERKLERQRWVSRGVVGTMIAALLYAGGLGYRSWSTPVFDGNEGEPNDDPAHANEIPIGRSVSGSIGKRIDRERPDVDFFRITIPSGVDAISIRMTALPNMALCTLVFPRGEVEPIARLCPGRARVDLVAPVFKLASGSYYFAITQDRASHGKSRPDVVENVSDAYHFTIDRSRELVGEEIEPNDSPNTAPSIASGAHQRGHLAWVDDVDVVCASASQQRVRWVVSDGEQAQTRGSVIELTQSAGAAENKSVRVHSSMPAGSNVKPSEVDVLGPWKSPAFVAEAPGVQCVRIRRAIDAWLGDETYSHPPVGQDGWKVSLEPAP